MIKVLIEKHTTTTQTVKEHRLVKSTPTEIRVAKGYSGEDKVERAEEYAPVETTKTETVRTTLLQQEIQNEESFDLAAVIKAINKING